MTILRAQVTIPRDTGLPEDVVTNTFYFNTGGDYLVADGAAIQTNLKAFYEKVTAGWSIVQMFSKALVVAQAQVKVYDLSDPEPRIPKGQFPLTLAEPTNAGSLPSELCVCASFHAAFDSGGIKARKRGRIFLGPVNDGAMTVVNNEPYVSTATLNTVTAAMSQLMSMNTALFKWSVYSQVDAATAGPVVGGWCDNAFDIQRRRGVAATNRASFGGG